MEQQQVERVLDAALMRIKSRRPNSRFDISLIKRTMEEIVHAPMPDVDVQVIKTMMLARWGRGVEPESMDNELWKFGFSRPPVSREIPHRF